MQRVLNSAFSPSWHTCNHNFQELLRIRQYIDEGFENLGCGTCHVLFLPSLDPSLHPCWNPDRTPSSPISGVARTTRWGVDIERKPWPQCVCADIVLWLFMHKASDGACLNNQDSVLNHNLWWLIWIGALEGVALSPSNLSGLGLEGRRKEKHFSSFPNHKHKPFHDQIFGLSFSFIHQGYYKRTQDYLPIYNRERVGCFQVPVVHSTMLIDLRSQRSDASRQLTYWPAPEGFKGPVDDVVQFAFSAKKEGELWRTCFLSRAGS